MMAPILIPWGVAPKTPRWSWAKNTEKIINRVPITEEYSGLTSDAAALKQSRRLPSSPGPDGLPRPVPYPDWYISRSEGGDVGKGDEATVQASTEGLNNQSDQSIPDAKLPGSDEPTATRPRVPEKDHAHSAGDHEFKQGWSDTPPYRSRPTKIPRAVPAQEPCDSFQFVQQTPERYPSHFDVKSGTMKHRMAGNTTSCGQGQWRVQPLVVRDLSVANESTSAHGGQRQWEHRLVEGVTRTFAVFIFFMLIVALCSMTVKLLRIRKAKKLKKRLEAERWKMEMALKACGH